MTPPFFSVVIPTYKRPDLLRMAVQSALEQTFTDLEVVVSDDEPSCGAAWAMLEALAASDPRLRPTRNTGPRGQVGNTNHGITQASGRWIKLLHDDDQLHPDCLQRIGDMLARVPPGRPVAVVSCRSDTISESGEVRRWHRGNGRPVAELIPSEHIVRAMYLQEDVGESLPTSTCINRDLLVARQAWMPQQAGFVSVVDSHWAILLAALGDRLIINESLVTKRSEPVSVTGSMTDEALDREFVAIRELQFHAIPAHVRRPPLRAAQQALWIRRAAHRLLKRRRPWEALTLAARAWDPRAWILTLHTALTRRFPGLWSETRRIVLDPAIHQGERGSPTPLATTYSER